MEQKINKRKLLYFLAMLCFAVQLITGAAMAAGRSASLTLDLAVGGGAVEGVNCSLYRVADLNGTAFTTTEQFKAADVKLNGVTKSEDWQAAANSLAVYAGATANKVQPTTSGVSDSSGRIASSGLETGLYLAVFTPVTHGVTTYSFQPTLVALPQWSTTGVDYSVEATPKGTSSTYIPGGSTVSVTVLKIWNDSSEGNRPSSVTAVLLKDGADAGTVVLSAQNNWRYTWTGLSDSCTWTVLEKNVPDGYTVTYTTDGTVRVITNTHTTNIPDTPTPGTNIPDTPTPGSGKLPQTGQLWWPVPVLAVCGLMLFGIGWGKRNGHD
jgi:hypothetical protein